jgi:hypothetical protein
LDWSRSVRRASSSPRRHCQVLGHRLPYLGSCLVPFWHGSCEGVAFASLGNIECGSESLLKFFVAHWRGRRMIFCLKTEYDHWTYRSVGVALSSETSIRGM